jgi:tartrate dehydratase beta subunit/fumarate hydratase class I family protein
MSTRTALYALAYAVAMLTLPAAASARPIDHTGPVVTPTAEHAVSSGPTPLLFVAAALAVVLAVVALQVVRARSVTVKA